LVKIFATTRLLNIHHTLTASLHYFVKYKLSKIIIIQHKNLSSETVSR